MKSYLTDSKQFVRIDDTQSDFSNIITSVTQGSILGPLLFIIYINDICQASKVFDFIIYANDTSLSTTFDIILKKDNSTSIQNTMNNRFVNINDWLKLHKIQKTKYMIFHTPPFQIKKEDINIDQVSDFNFLGITINDHLHWKTHVDKFSHKKSRNIGILNKLIHFLPLRTKILILNSLIVSNINYGLLVWRYTCERLFKLQQKVIRIISVSKYNTHTEPIFKQQVT